MTSKLFVLYVHTHSIGARWKKIKLKIVRHTAFFVSSATL